MARNYYSVYIGLGSNQGDRLANLQSAILTLPPTVRVLAESPVYETTPWGYIDQPDFLNQVVRAETKLTPRQLLEYLKSIEADLGRATNFRYGPRPIDLDILLFNDLTMQTPDLTIPHPRLAERAFVLVPLADLSPDLHHPVSGQAVSQLRDRLDPQGIRLYRSHAGPDG